jgi:hypothetical protein
MDVSKNRVCGQKTFKFFVFHQKEFMAGHLGVKALGRKDHLDCFTESRYRIKEWLADSALRIPRWRLEGGSRKHAS